MIDTLFLSPSLSFTTLVETSTQLNFTQIHFTTLHCPLTWLKSNYISYHSISPHITTLHFISLQFNAFLECFRHNSIPLASHLL